MDDGTLRGIREGGKTGCGEKHPGGLMSLRGVWRTRGYLGIVAAEAVAISGMPRSQDDNYGKKMKLSALLTQDEEPREDALLRQSLGEGEEELIRTPSRLEVGAVERNMMGGAAGEERVASRRMIWTMRGESSTDDWDIRPATDSVMKEMHGEGEEDSSLNREEEGGASSSSGTRGRSKSSKKRRSRIFQCDLCSGSFTSRRDLETHVRTVHEKLRPYKCPHCDSHFGTKSNLNTHTKSVHEGKRPFPCVACTMAFKTRGNLETHVLTVHEHKRPFSCEYCQATFGTKSVMNRHIRIIHKRDDSSQ